LLAFAALVGLSTGSLLLGVVWKCRRELRQL
jgi:hypothetical protein